MYNRLEKLLLEGSLGRARLSRVKKSGKVDYFLTAKKSQYKKLNAEKRAGMFPSIRHLRAYAKLPYKKFIKASEYSGHLKWHGNVGKRALSSSPYPIKNMAYVNPKISRSVHKAIHVGTKHAAMQMAYNKNKVNNFLHPYLRRIFKNRNVHVRHKRFKSASDNNFYYSTKRMHVSPILVSKPKKHYDVNSKKINKKFINKEFKVKVNDKLTKQNKATFSDYLANRKIQSVSPSLTYRVNAPHSSLSDLVGLARERSFGGIPRIKKDIPDVVTYSNPVEDSKRINHAVLNPRNLLTYRALIRRYGNRRKNMVTGKIMSKKKR